MDLKNLDEYSVAQINRFNYMQDKLNAYNEQVRAGEKEVMEKPMFTDKEMMEYSRYRQLFLADKAKALYP